MKHLAGFVLAATVAVAAGVYVLLRYADLCAGLGDIDYDGF